MADGVVGSYSFNSSDFGPRYGEESIRWRRDRKLMFSLWYLHDSVAQLHGIEWWRQGLHRFDGRRKVARFAEAEDKTRDGQTHDGMHQAVGASGHAPNANADGITAPRSDAVDQIPGEQETEGAGQFGAGRTIGSRPNHDASRRAD